MTNPTVKIHLIILFGCTLIFCGCETLRTQREAEVYSAPVSSMVDKVEGAEPDVKKEMDKTQGIEERTAAIAATQKVDEGLKIAEEVRRQDELREQLARENAEKQRLAVEIEAKAKTEREKQLAEIVAKQKAKEEMKMAEKARQERDLRERIARDEAEKQRLAAEMAKLPDQLVQEQKMIVTAESKAPPVIKREFGNVTGTVKILSKGKYITPNDVMINLEPTVADLVNNRPPKTHLIEMKGKNFLPRHNLIRVGDTVIFKNLDPFKHNVFSSTGNNKFDLGTYGGGTEPKHVFEHPGIIKVYCNIHPSMASFVMAGATDFNDIIGKDGLFKIESIPPGEYKLRAWHIRGTFNEIIVIKANETTSVDIQIDASTYREKQHLNKYGKKYKKRLSDESY